MSLALSGLQLTHKLIGRWTNVTCFRTSHGPWRGLPEGPNDVNNKGPEAGLGEAHYLEALLNKLATTKLFRKN